MVENTNPDCEPHPAIMLVSAYLVERGLILQSHQVNKKTNEMQRQGRRLRSAYPKGTSSDDWQSEALRALPELIESLALSGVVFAFDAINTQKKLLP